MRQNDILDDISAAIGFSGTCALAGHFGGSMVYIPKEPSEGSPLLEVLSPAEYRRLVSEFPGKSIRIPNDTAFTEARRTRIIRAMNAAGISLADIGAVLGVSHTTAARAVKQAK